MNSGLKHIDVGNELTKSEWESQQTHQLVHGTSFPASPVERQLFYRDDEHKWYIYNGSAWVDLQGAGNGMTIHGNDYHDPNFEEEGTAAAEVAAHAAIADAHHVKTGDNEVYGLLQQGLAADRPAPSVAGRLYYSTDTKVLERDTGAAWEEKARGETAIRLAQLAEKAHSSLTGVGTDDHHARYTDSEAEAVAGGVVAAHEAKDSEVHGAGAHKLLHSGMGQLFVPITPARVYNLTGISSSPRTATIDSVSGDVITLTGNHAYRFWRVNMNGNSYLKIANTSKSPVEFAWVKASPAGDAGNQLQVTVAGDISGWANGNTISTAQDGATSEWTQLDLSPSLPAGTTGVFALIGINETGTITKFYGCALRRDSTADSVSIHPQVTDVYMAGLLPCALTNDLKLEVRDRAGGTDTLRNQVYILAYTV